MVQRHLGAGGAGDGGVGGARLDPTTSSTMASASPARSGRQGTSSTLPVAQLPHRDGTASPPALRRRHHGRRAVHDGTVIARRSAFAQWLSRHAGIPHVFAVATASSGECRSGSTAGPSSPSSPPPRFALRRRAPPSRSRDGSDCNAELQTLGSGSRVAEEVSVAVSRKPWSGRLAAVAVFVAAAASVLGIGLSPQGASAAARHRGRRVDHALLLRRWIRLDPGRAHITRSDPCKGSRALCRPGRRVPGTPTLTGGTVSP